MGMSRLDGEDSEGKVKVHWFVEDQLKKEMREDAKKQCADAYISLGKCTESKKSQSSERSVFSFGFGC